MSIYSYFQIAFKELKRQPAFSLLAVFALMIGTTLVTVFSAMFDFNRQAYILIARSIGARELTVTPIGSNTSFIDLLGPPVVKVQDIQSSIVVFSLKDLELAKTSVPHLDYAYAKQNIAFIPMNSSKSIEGIRSIPL